MDASSVGSQPEVSGPDVSRDEFRELAVEVRDLARRISALEHGAVAQIHETAPPVPHLAVSSELVPAIGKALLAIAGAYLLRAFTDLRILPGTAGVAAGIVYAAIWLWLAARSVNQTTARLYAATSLLILGPLLWEAVGSLHVLPASLAAILLAAFAIAVSHRAAIAPIASAAAALIAFALLIGLRELPAFSLALLAITAAAELAETKSRWTTALLADFGVIVFTVVIARGVPPDYPPASPREALFAQILLATLYAAVLFGRRRELTLFEIFQTACAFLIAAGGAFVLTDAARPLAWILIAASAAAYACLFLRRAPERNVRAFAVLSIAAALAGTYLLLPVPALAMLWSAFGIAIAFSHVAAFHAWIYLWSAAAVSGVAMQAKLRVWDDADAPLTLEAFAVLIGALIAYLVLAHSERIGSALATAAAGVVIAAALSSRVAPGALVLALFAMALAWIGAHTRRRELVWLTYGLMTVAAAKIVLHDFARGTMSLVVSLLGYGIALILLPRILQRRRA